MSTPLCAMDREILSTRNRSVAPCGEPGTEPIMVIDYGTLYLCPVHAAMLAEQGALYDSRYMEQARRAPVEWLLAQGVHLDPDNPDASCLKCGHPWGRHELYVLPGHEPADGGWIECGDDNCYCHTTFGGVVGELGI
jgi:hypothetical protein